MEARSLRVPAADGLSLHVLEWSREGVPLLLLHGFGNEAHIWDELAPQLAPYYRVLAVDLRGHGDSDHDPEGRYELASHVRDLERLIEELRIERLVLVGHSLGGRIAMLFAGAHPERMAGLVIVDAGPELEPRGTTRIRMEVAQRGSRGEESFPGPAEYQRVLAHAYPAASPSAIARMARHELRQREDGRWVRKLDRAFHAGWLPLDPQEQLPLEAESRRQLWQALAKVSCPALVVRGAASDVLSPEVAERMAEEVLSDGRLALVPQAGHSVMTDNPVGFAAAVSDFVLGPGS